MQTAEKSEKSAVLILERIKTALQKAESISNVNASEIDKDNQQAISLMMQGKTKKALELSLETLEKSGRNLELRAQCLINIGDWLRRIIGALDSALAIFAQAEKLPISTLTRSRLKAMEAMVYIFPTESGQDDPEGVQKNIAVLKEAVKIARQGHKENPEKAIMTESFALHRLSGTVGYYGTSEQKVSLIEDIKKFLPRLHPDSAEVARFNYTMALIITEQDLEQSARMLLESAFHMLCDNESPLDACGYFCLAAERYLKLGKKMIAKTCLEQAEILAPKLTTHANSEHAIRLLNELKVKLNQ